MYRSKRCKGFDLDNIYKWKNGARCRQFIYYIIYLTSAGAPAEIFRQEEMIRKVPNIPRYLHNERGPFAPDYSLSSLFFKIPIYCKGMGNHP